MKVRQLIEKLELQNPDAIVYVDFDIEGGNETAVTHIEDFVTLFGNEDAIVLR